MDTINENSDYITGKLEQLKRLSEEKDNKIVELCRENLRLNVEIQQLKANSIKNNMEILNLIDKVRNTIQ